MAEQPKPWEEYQQAAPAAPASDAGGPWQEYKQPIPPAAAAGAQALAERNAKPHVWDDFAKKWGLTGEDLKNYAKSAAAGLAEGVINAPSALGGPAKLVDVGVSYLTGATPQEHVRAAAAALGAPFHEARPGTADPYIETASSFLPLAAAGGGGGPLAGRLASAVTGGVASEAAGQAARRFGPTAETVARIAAGTGAGVGPGAALRTLPRSAATTAERNVIEALRPQYPTAQEAITRGRELGPAAAVYNVGERTQGQMSTLAASPTAAGTRARQLLEQQVRGAQPRVDAGLDQVFGPGQTAYRQQIEEQLKRQGQRSVYEMARGQPIDAAPISTAITEQLDRFPKGGSADKALSRVSKMLTANRNDANAALGVRSEIDNLITKAGGIKGYEAGLRTPTGAALTPIRQAINDALPAEVRRSDQVLSTSHRIEEGGRVGREEIIGGGAKMDPEQLASIYGPAGTASAAEKAAALAGARQQAAHRLGELQAEAGIGKATTNALASQNVIERVRAIAGPAAAQQLEQLAMRENVIGGAAGRTAHGSATAMRLLGAKDMPIPGERMVSPGGGTTAAVIGSAGLAGAPAAAGLAILNSGLKKIANATMKSRDTAVASAMSDLLTATGGDRDMVLQRLYAMRPHLPPTGNAYMAVNALINGFMRTPGPGAGPGSEQPAGLLQ